MIVHQTINNLRDAGYLVVIWTPEELVGVDLGHVEDRVIELGNEVIDNLRADGVDSSYMDDSDDAQALASAGHGTDEDYGSAEDVL